MIVHRIDTLDEFEQIQDHWQTIHQQDPHAHIYASWAWLRGYIQSTPFEWFVLAIVKEPSTRPESLDPALPYCAFVFLTLESKAFNTWRILRLGGTPLADYTGFVCLPALEQSALAAAATYIKAQLTWDQLHLWDVLDPRLDHFTAHFANEAFRTSDYEQTPCPYIDLTDSWDEFLLTKLSKTVRKKVNRRTRQVEALPGFRVETVNQLNLDSQIDTLFQLWAKKWQQPADEGLRPIFYHLFQAGQLWLATLWDQETPLAALAGFVDPAKGTFYAFMGAYNDAYDKLSPGSVLDGRSLRYAIENHFTRYDYLRGDHEYKFRWGADRRTIPRFEITRRSVRTTVMVGVIATVKKLSS